MGDRSKGPFESAGLAYSSSRTGKEVPRPKAAPPPLPPRARSSARTEAIPVLDAEPIEDAPARTPVTAPTSMFLGPPPQRDITTLPPPAPEAMAAVIASHVLTLPPNPPRPRRSRTRVNAGAVAIVALLASAAAFGGVGGVWMRARTPDPLVLATPSVDPEPAQSSLAEFATDRAPAHIEAAPRATPARRGFHGTTSASHGAHATHDTAMDGRAPALPPPRRSTSVARHESNRSCAERCNGNIDCLLTCRPDQPTNTSTDALVAPVPTREQIAMAMHSVRGAVLLCGMSIPADAERTALVTVTFDHTGHARSASVAAPYAGTPAGSCIARAVQHASVPAFSQSDFRLTYPFAVH